MQIQIRNLNINSNTYPQKEKKAANLKSYASFDNAVFLKSNIYQINFKAKEHWQILTADARINEKNIVKLIRAEIAKLPKTNFFKNLYGNQKIIEDIHSWLKIRLVPNKYEHSVQVQDKVMRLAALVGIDVEKAGLAGLLHDCAKNFSPNINESIAKRLKLPETPKEFDEYHGSVCAAVAKIKIGITDPEILEAIMHHDKSLNGEMSTLAKILFIADKSITPEIFQNAFDSLKFAPNKLVVLDEIMKNTKEAEIQFKQGLKPNSNSATILQV